MTKKTFIAIAAGFKARMEGHRMEGHESTYNEDLKIARKRETEACARMFADVAKADNARFDRQRFLTACGF